MDKKIGKKISVFYDSLGHAGRKDGTLTSLTPTELILDDKIIIPRNRLIRIEVIN